MTFHYSFHLKNLINYENKNKYSSVICTYICAYKCVYMIKFYYVSMSVVQSQQYANAVTIFN